MERPAAITAAGLTCFLQPLLWLALAVLALALGGCNSLSPPEAETVRSETGLSALNLKLGHSDFQLPASLSLCGEALALDRQAVLERLEYEFIRVVNHPAQVALWQRRAAIYFPFIEESLKAAGLPGDLKYLAVAESDLRPFVASPAGAVGLWQFMPATARAFGLTVNKGIDQRQLPEPLLGAAESYFKALHQRFGSWALSMAAYNAGEGRIGRAIKEQNTEDYFSLDLPRETERYVYRIAAIKVVLENAELYGLSSSTPLGAYRPAPYVEKQVTVGKNRSWTEVAQQLGCNYKMLRLLNPHIRQSTLSGDYQLRVPLASAKNLVR